MPRALPSAIGSLQTLTFTAGVTCQLGLLSAISYERFHCVTYPFRTTSKQARRLRIELGVVWLVAVVCSLVDVRLTPDSALTVLSRGGRLPHNFANSFCLLHFPVGAVNIVIIGTFYLRIYLEIKEHVKKMTDKTLARRTQQAVERPFEPPSASASAGARRISFMFPPSTPMSGSAPAFFSGMPGGGGGRRRWLPLPPLRIFPSRRRVPYATAAQRGVVADAHSVPSGGSPQNQPTVPLLDAAALSSLVPEDALRPPAAKYLPSASAGVEGERLSVIREPPDTPRLASADSDSGVGESSCGTEAATERPRATGTDNTSSDIYTSATSASGGRPLSFAGIPLIDESDGEGELGGDDEPSIATPDADETSPDIITSLHRSSTRRSRRRPALLELSSVDESVGPVPAVDIDGNVTLTRSTRQNRLAGAVCVMNSKARLRGKKKMEGKMAVRAVLIIVAFLLFWLPLVVCAVISESLLSTDFDRWAAPLADLQVVTVCFCNLSVVANPVLYGLMVQQYRTALRQLVPARLKRLVPKRWCGEW